MYTFCYMLHNIQLKKFLHELEKFNPKNATIYRWQFSNLVKVFDSDYDVNKISQWDASIHCNWPIVKLIVASHWLFFLCHNQSQTLLLGSSFSTLLSPSLTLSLSPSFSLTLPLSLSSFYIRLIIGVIVFFFCTSFLPGFILPRTPVCKR